MNFFTKALILTFFTFLTIFASAQDGTYDVRFETNSIDCNNNKIYVNLDVRANSANGDFNIADQNYRFSYNRKAVVVGSLAIDSMHLTGFIGSSLYDPHNLNGSLDTVVSYNVVLAGGTGELITTDWRTIGRISFDILDIDQCLDLIWHDHSPSMFPPTFISEKLGTNLYETTEALYLNGSSCPAPICNAFPIELASFEAAEEDCAAVIEWTTASEVDNDYFELERSSDGETFTVIATINGAGTSNALLSYTYTDSKASATNYYRLRQVDFDGTSTTSNTILLRSTCFEEGTAFTMSEVYPNPVTTGPVNLTFYTEMDINSAEVVVTDVTGRLIYTATTEIALGSNNLTIDSDQFASGTYFVQVRSNNWRTNAKKFVKLMD